MSLDSDYEKRTTGILTDAMLRKPLHGVCPKVPIIVTPETSIRGTIEIMREHQEGAVLICDDEHNLLGIFTERDLILRAIPHGLDSSEDSIETVMTENPTCLGFEDTIGKALHTFVTYGFRHVPLLGSDGRPHGLVSIRSLLSYMGSRVSRTDLPAVEVGNQEMRHEKTVAVAAE